MARAEQATGVGLARRAAERGHGDARVEDAGVESERGVRLEGRASVLID